MTNVRGVRDVRGVRGVRGVRDVRGERREGGHMALQGSTFGAKMNTLVILAGGFTGEISTFIFGASWFC
jgi:hypothetical protein